MKETETIDISVIVVTYNQGATVGRTLDSILSQRTEARYEIIIGDDASTDSTEEVCRRYAGRYPDRIRYERRKHNMGVTLNYFTCIQQARGRYIADCAGDDFWIDNDKLQRQFEILEANPQVSLTATAWQESDPDGSNPRAARALLPAGEIEVYVGDIVLQRLSAHLCTALYRREAVMAELKRTYGQIVHSYYPSEDLSILAACAAQGNFYFEPVVTLNYCVGHDSISHREDAGRLFAYYHRDFRQILCLRTLYGIRPDEDAARRDSERLKFMAATALEALHDGLRQLLRDDFRSARKSGIRGLKTRLYGFAASHRLVWKVAAWLKSL